LTVKDGCGILSKLCRGTARRAFGRERKKGLVGSKKT
jgi:hypothetical protein